jgi:hypothetical protein
MSTIIVRRDGGYFTTPNRWVDAGYMQVAPGSVTQVYLFLCRWADNNTQSAAQPMRAIAYKCGLSEDVARKAVRTLEAWGVIERDADQGQNAVNIWHLNNLLEIAPEYPDKVPPKEITTPQQSAPPLFTTPLTTLTNQPIQGVKELTPIIPQNDKTRKSPVAEFPEVDHDIAFAEIWAAYPRHVNKLQARKAFAKIKLTPELVDQMLDTIKVWSQSAEWNRGERFIPHLSSWLNAERWEDAAPETAGSKPNGVLSHEELLAIANGG